MNLSLKDIRNFLNSHPRRTIDDQKLIRAGVLIPLFPKDGVLHVLFTKRTSEVEHHKGQISFPGGVTDESDADIVSTALRESKEEIGLSQENVEILGIFDDLPTPTGFIITPVVGYLPEVPPLKPNHLEVAEIFDVPLPFFLNRQNERVVPMERQGKGWDVYFYSYQNTYEIWGATAYILRSFLTSLLDERHYDSTPHS